MKWQTGHRHNIWRNQQQQQETMKRYLPEYKVFSDDGLDSLITPNVPV